MFLIFLFFLLSHYVSLRSEFCVVMSVKILHKSDVRSQLFVGVPLDCLIYFICICLRILVSNTYCVVFLICFSTSCCQFLWIVHFLLPLRNSLAFIYIANFTWTYPISMVSTLIQHHHVARIHEYVSTDFQCFHFEKLDREKNSHSCDA